MAGRLLPEEVEVPPHLEKKRPKVVVLSGPTSAGKSALALMLADALGGEIISADSIQVYRGLDIGTAKPSFREQKQVPHHLIDILDLTESFNVFDFYLAASHHCQQVIERGAVPIVVGGTGFYIHALIYGPPEGPTPDLVLRKKLDDEWEREGAEYMYEKLRQLDLEYAGTITCHDRQKVIRALEIIELTGGKVSQLKWKGKRVPKAFDFRCWFVTRPRVVLYERINRRCEKMLALGLLEEVSQLMERGLRKNLSAANAIGYRQSLEFFESAQTREDYLKFLVQFQLASRHYAKRQLTWFRREPLFEWIDLDLHDPEAAVELIARDLEM